VIALERQLDGALVAHVRNHDGLREVTPAIVFGAMDVGYLSLLIVGVR
jgi:hypothetical protein